MSDTLNNLAAVSAAEVVEQITLGKQAAEEEARTYRRKYEAAASERSYFRKELRNLGIQANAARGIEETLTRRLKAHQRDAMPGDRIAAAAVIECQAVLDIVKTITRGPDADPS